MKPDRPPKLPLVPSSYERKQSKPPMHRPEQKSWRGTPEKPDDLSPVASEEWDRIVPGLDRLGVLSPLDRTMLRVYCEAVATCKEALDKVIESGVLIRGARGEERVKHPAAQIVRDSASMIRLYGADFGLTPAARLRLNIPDHEIDDLEDILRGPQSTTE